MEVVGKFIVAAIILFVVGGVGWFFLGMWIKAKWPAQIPEELQFATELTSDLKLREVAENLAERFNDFNSDEVVCLGPVRGTAARVLFHAGPKNAGRNKNIHRNDYVLYVERLGTDRVRLRLDTNKSYSYYRINRREVEALNKALSAAFGELTVV